MRRVSWFNGQARFGCIFGTLPPDQETLDAWASQFFLVAFHSRLLAPDRRTQSRTDDATPWGPVGFPSPRINPPTLVDALSLTREEVGR